MATADAAARGLVNLRRFTRLLLGNRRDGDALAAAAYEAVIAPSPSSRDQEGEERILLYREAVRIWRDVWRCPENDSLVNVLQSIRDEKPAMPTIASVQAVARAAFLLRAVEKFPASVCARIIDVSSGTFDRMYLFASQQVSSIYSCDVLVIEDEPLIAIELEELLTGLGHRVVGTAPTSTAAIALAKKERPRLILADVHLADGSSGDDAVLEIQRGMDVPAIFVTAYPERLLTGLGCEPTFIVAKPFKQEMLAITIALALYGHESRPGSTASEMEYEPVSGQRWSQ